MDERAGRRTGCAGPLSEAEVCRSAAMRLREHPMRRSTLHESRLASATSQLLDALGRAIDRDVAAVPVPVRQAALRLARECFARGASSDPGADRDDTDARTPRCAAGPDAECATRSRPRIPRLASIELGRMG